MKQGFPQPLYERTRMKSLMSLWKVLAQDMGEWCSVDTTLDYKTVERRTKSEGQSFLTITLPAFGKAFERWLELERIDLSLVPGFRSRAGFPLFLRGFLDQIFDSRGVILDDASTTSILAVRQLCGVFGKMFLPASAERTHSAMMQYLETDDEVEKWEREWTPDGDLAFSRISALLFSGIFDRVNGRVAAFDLIPKHGPGATAEKFLGNQKFSADWYERLEDVFPAVHYWLPNESFYSELSAVNFVSPGAESPIRVIHVPKTQKTPRIIGIEPVCMQFTQQAVGSALDEEIRHDRIVKRFLRLHDQVPNQVLAREGSLSGTLATLDLSEASDRVSNLLVRHMMNNWKHLDDAVQACRSQRATIGLEGGEVTRTLSKFASMGSALTFPIESMVFLTVVFVGIERDLGRHLSRADISRLAGQVAVYGDDIVAPTVHVGSIIHALESFGFKVNSSKSFWNGKFRESCGKDYYNGVDVSYVKFRDEWPDDRQSAEQVVSLVSFFNQVKSRHYSRTTCWLRKKLVGLLGIFPRVAETSAILGEHVTEDFTVDSFKANGTQVPLTRGYMVSAEIPVNPLDGHRALLKFFLHNGDEPLEREHLQRSGRPRSVSIKIGMAPTR